MGSGTVASPAELLSLTLDTLEVFSWSSGLVT